MIIKRSLAVQAFKALRDACWLDLQQLRPEGYVRTIKEFSDRCDYLIKSIANGASIELED